MRRSAPQPAIRKTPTGGTRQRISVFQRPSSTKHEQPTKNCDENEKKGRNRVCICHFDGAEMSMSYGGGNRMCLL